MTRIACFLLLFSLHYGLFAQSHQLSGAVPVLNATGDTLTGAWSGAMNNAQFSTIDLNEDGKLDLVYFDRLDQTFTPLLNTATQPGETRYVYAPEYKARFDSCDCFGWAKLVDYNCDGREDILCGMTVSNVLVYENVAYADSFGFELKYFQLESLYGFGLSWLYAGKIDYPGIADIDHDGDIDFLTFGLSSNYIEWHRNMAVEQTGKCDTLIIEQETRCWGHFYESNSNNTAFLFDTLSFSCALPPDFDPDDLREPAGNSSRHEGSTILLLDLDADSTFDALIGDVSFNDVYALYNGGTIQHAYIDSVQRLFPDYDIPINTRLFPANFYVDIDNDGKRDLLSAPNYTTDIEDIEGVSLYHNDGADNAPVFSFSHKGFLQENTLDVGTGAAPAFFHYNGDTLPDLLIGNFGVTYLSGDSALNYGKLALYQNIGTATAPAYQLVDDDFLDLTTQTGFSGLRGIAPAAGDLDGDGDDDILLGNADGALWYFENVAPAGHTGTYQFVTATYGNVNVTAYSAPCLYDIDGDNDLDLFVGNRSGRIAFYENKGSATASSFVLIASEWGFIKLVEEGGGIFSNGHSRPLIYDYDGDGEPELLVGGQPGDVFIYENVANALSDTLDYVGNLFNFDFGSYSSPTVAVLDTSGFGSFVVGNRRGGLQLFQVPLPQDTTQDTTTTALEPILPQQLTVQIFPNPASGEVRLVFEGPNAGKEKEIDLVNVMGQALLRRQTQAEELRLDLSAFAEGIYYLRIRTEQRQQVEKLLISH